MKIKIKLSMLVIAIMALVISGLAALLLSQASGMSHEATLQSIRNLTGQRAEYWKGREDGNLRVLKTLASVMSGYEDLPPQARRDRFDNILESTIKAEKYMIDLYTVWKPDAIDGLDSEFGGQYAATFTRENGIIESRRSADINASMAYLSGVNADKDRVEPPFQRTVNGKDVFLFKMMVPITNPRTGEIVGGVGCVLPLDVIQPILESVIKSHEEIIIMVIYANNGQILSHVFPERVGKMIYDVDLEFGAHIDRAVNALREGKRFEGEVYDTTFKTNVFLNMEPFRIGNSDMTWSVLIGTAESYIMQDVTRMTRYTIMITVISIIAAAVVVFFVLTYITKPIVKVTETLKDISEGEGDLTRAIPIKGSDEITDLSRYFNKTIEKIKNLIMIMKKQVITLYDTGNELASNMSQTTAAVNEIAANIQTIKERITSQGASVNETGETMEQITKNINKLNEHIEAQAASVTESSASIEQMLANIKSVTNTLVKNDESMRELIGASETGRTSLENVVNDIQEISQESEGLLQINSVINNIASQTNLLSMNAAIEAAHAGNAGKGFAVVADEIRKLAESSREQSKIIGNVLKKMKESIDKITNSTSHVLSEFEMIHTGVKTVSDQEDSILHAMEEQNEGSKQILEAVQELNSITQQVKGESVEMLEGSAEVIVESKNLDNVTREITRRINEMATGADQINTAIKNVNEISVKNKENIELLVEEISMFKVE
jgi:methyl-accepting chemotaxis protein